MTQHQSSDWKLLAEQASKEMDSEKLMILVNQLNRVLLEQEEVHLRLVHGSDPQSFRAVA